MRDFVGYEAINMKDSCCICKRTDRIGRYSNLGGVISGHPFNICLKCLTHLVFMVHQGLAPTTDGAIELTDILIEAFIKSREALPSIAELKENLG